MRIGPRGERIPTSSLFCQINHKLSDELNEFCIANHVSKVGFVQDAIKLLLAIRKGEVANPQSTELLKQAGATASIPRPAPKRPEALIPRQVPLEPDPPIQRVFPRLPEDEEEIDFSL